MALNFLRAVAAVNAEADAISTLLNGGKLLLYGDTQIVTADTVVVAQELLAELAFDADAAPAAVDEDPSANNDGTATWFLATMADDTPVFCGSVAATGGTADCIINSTAISSGAAVSVVSMTYTAVKSV
jgi:hypothetical protein